MKRSFAALLAALLLVGCASEVKEAPQQATHAPITQTQQSNGNKTDANLERPAPESEPGGGKANNEEVWKETALAFVNAATKYDVASMKRLVRTDMVATVETTFDWRDKKTGELPKVLGGPAVVTVMTEYTGSEGLPQPIIELHIEDNQGKRIIRVAVPIAKEDGTWRVADLWVLP